MTEDEKEQKKKTRRCGGRAQRRCDGRAQRGCDRRRRERRRREHSSLPPPAGDAAITREVVIRVNMATARVEVDGSVVEAPRGEARVTLADGPHKLAVSAAGRAPFEKTIEVSSSLAPVVVRLERVKRPSTTDGGAPTPTSGSGTPQQSDRAKNKDDYVIDPF